jgi:hypothetical protein
MGVAGCQNEARELFQPIGGTFSRLIELKGMRNDERAGMSTLDEGQKVTFRHRCRSPDWQVGR